MRSIWLASAAFILGASAACAQSAPPMPGSMPAAPPPPVAPAPPPGGWMRGPLPEDAPPDVYLHIAQAALAHHDASRADDALSYAETRLLDRSVIQGPAIPQDNSPAVSAIEQARQALQAHDFANAAQATDAALQALPPPAPPAP